MESMRRRCGRAAGLCTLLAVAAAELDAEQIERAARGVERLIHKAVTSSDDALPLDKPSPPPRCGRGFESIEWNEQLSSWERFASMGPERAMAMTPSGDRWHAVWGQVTDTAAVTFAIQGLVDAGSVDVLVPGSAISFANGDRVSLRWPIAFKEDVVQGAFRAAGLPAPAPGLAEQHDDAHGVVVKSSAHTVVVRFDEATPAEWPKVLLQRVGPFAVGDQVRAQRGMRIVTKDGWTLEKDAFAAVHAVDQDGDVRLSNPAGEVSGWTWARHFERASQVRCRECFASSQEPSVLGTWYGNYGRHGWAKVTVTAGEPGSDSLHASVLQAGHVSGTAWTSSGKLQRDGDAVAGTAQAFADNGFKQSQATIRWRAGNITVSSNGRPVATFYRGMRQANCGYKTEFLKLKDSVIPAGADLLTELDAMTMTAKEALRECKQMDDCKGVSYKGSDDVKSSERHVVYLKGKSDVMPLEGWTSFLKNVEFKCKQKSLLDAIASELEAQYKADAQVNPPAVLREPMYSRPTPASDAAFKAGRDALFAAGENEVHNATLAAEHFQAAASTGHPEAHFFLGLLRTLGLGVEPSETLAVLHYTFAAKGGSLSAALVLGHRHMRGIGVPKSCADARRYYRLSADRVAWDYQHGRGSQDGSYDSVHLTDFGAPRKRQGVEHAVRFAEFQAERADAHQHQVLAGRQYLHGGSVFAQDLDKAQHFFELATKRDQGTDVSAHTALARIAAARTDPRRRNYTAAYHYSKTAALARDPEALNIIAWLYVKGQGLGKATKSRKQSLALARKVLQTTSNHGAGLYNRGIMAWLGLGGEPDQDLGEGLVQEAARLGVVPAVWQMAVGIPENSSLCPQAVGLLRDVSEGNLPQQASRAHQDYTDGNYEAALLRYLVLAEQGSELGQSNVAFMLNAGLGVDDFNFTMNPVYVSQEVGPSSSAAADEEFGRHALALKYYRQAAEQNSAEAFVKVGDYFYYGRGTERNMQKALQNYKQAGDRWSDQAAFNLGFMYEHGVAVPKDLHLAKRYYDQARLMNNHAYWAVTLALIKLSLHSWLHELFFPQSNVTTLNAAGRAPLCPKGTPTAGSAATCCDPDGSCTNDDDVWCCGQKIYCSHQQSVVQTLRRRQRTFVRCPDGQYTHATATATVLGMPVNLEDLALGGSLLVLFLLLFIKHTARQVHQPHPVPAAAAGAADGAQDAAATHQAGDQPVDAPEG